MIKVDKETPLNSLLSHLEEAWFLSVVGNEALLYGPGGETEGPWPQDVYEPLIKDGSLVAFADDKYVLRRYLDCADLLELWGGTVLAPWERPGSLLAVMQANPTAELVVTMDPGHPAYLRDSTNREKFLDGPFEQYEYQPLIDSGELVESEEFRSVFVLATTAVPPDFSEVDFSPANSACVLEIMRKNPGSFLMGDAMVCLFADDSGTEESVLLHNLNPDCFQRLAKSGELVGVGQCHWTLKGDQVNG